MFNMTLPLQLVDQDAFQREVFEFLTYLNQNGFDISTLNDGSLLYSQQRELTGNDANNEVNKEILDIESGDTKHT